VRGDEERVIVAFSAWLEQSGWTNIRREVEFVDIVAERGGQTLYVEAKGQTSSPGLDVDTMYGQLLRRMRHPEAQAKYAVVVPSSALQAALRVPDWVRGRLKIDVYAVDPDGGVEQAGS
jgi:Holliday junction resolvase